MLLCIQLFVLLLGGAMFVCPVKYKLSILLFSFISLSSITVDFIPFGGSEFFLSNCFFLSELPRLTKKIKQLKRSILYRLLCMMIVATIILAIFSPHYHDIYNLIRLLILELFGKYFVIAYAFTCIKKEDDFKFILKIVGIGLFLITIFGIQNLYTKQSWWFNMVFPDGTKRGLMGFEMSSRFRVQSMYENPFDYGYTCVLINLLYIYSYYKNYINRVRLLISSSACIFGVIFCGSRTLIAVYILSLLTFLNFKLSQKEKVKLFLIICTVIVGALILVPDILNNETTENYARALEVDVTANGSNGYGSSLGMRLLQLNAVLNHVQESFLFGKGKDFFYIDMGWGEGGLSTLVDKELWGLEGVCLSYLLERGIIGLSFWAIFYGSIFYFLYKRRLVLKNEVAFGLSILMSYLTFANMTGELNSVFPTLLTMGMIIKIMYIKEIEFKLS